MKVKLKIIQVFIRVLFIPYCILGLSENVKADKDVSQLRVITYNVYSFNGYPIDRLKLQGYFTNKPDKAIIDKVRTQIPTRLALELEIYAPDIISFQEVRGEANVAKVADLLGMNYAFFPGSPNADFPGAIITRYEILESTSRPILDGECPPELFTRHWGRVLIQADSEKIAVHTAHLYPGSANSQIRIREIREILSRIDDDIEKGYSVLIAGDLNHKPDTQEHREWIGAGFNDTWAQKNKLPGFTFPSTGAREDGEDYRIDYILTLGFTEFKLRDSKILYEGAFRTYKDSPLSFALSDHLPVISIFAKSENK